MFAWYHSPMKKWDFVILSILVIPSICFLLFFYGANQKATSISVYVGGEIIGEYDLSQELDLRIDGLNGITDYLRIHDGKACIYEASCPDKICRNQGEIHKNGQSLCCAPGGIIILINSGEESEYDAITQ